MKIIIAPKSITGKWSLGLIGGFALFLALLFIMAVSGQSGGETFTDNLWLAIPGLLAAICGIAAFFTGVIAIIKSKERSVFVFLAAFLGLDVLLFCLGEVISPH
jgi:hypothetical protein